MLRITCLLLLCVAGPAAAACDCPLIPREGLYSLGGDDVRISYDDGDADACPTVLRLEARPPNRPPVNVTLICNGTAFSGVEPTEVGTFTWTITPARDTDGLKPAQIAASGMADSLTLTLGVTSELKAIGKKDRSAPLQPTALKKAAPCLCQRVRDELEWAEAMGRGFADQDIINAATAQNIPAKKTTARYYVDSDNTLRRYPPARPKTTYRDEVQKVVVSRLQTKWQQQGYSVANTAPAAAGSAPSTRRNSQGGRGVADGAAASLNPADCTINMPDAATIRAECTPAVVYAAWHVHENTHRQTCLARNSRPVTTWKGDTITLNGGQVYGMSAPPSNYDAANHWPANLGADETAAYAAEAEVYSTWLKENCD